MRIFFILASPFPNYTGGRETWLYNVTRRIDASQAEIHIMVTESDEQPCAFKLDERLSLVKIRTLTATKWTRWLCRSYFRLLDYAIFVAKAASYLKKNSTPEDIIFAMGPIIEIMPAILSVKGKRTANLVCSVRTLHAETLARTFPIIKNIFFKLEEYSFKMSGKILCNGQDTLKYVREMGFQAEFMPNGVDFMKFAGARDGKLNDAVRKRFLVAATIQKVKGIDELLMACERLNAKNLAEKYLVDWVGKGDSASYASKARERGLARNIVFHGVLSNTRDFYRYADCALNLSGGGGMSMALLESMAAGCATIAWDSPVYRQLVVNGESAILVKENSWEELANAMERVITGNPDALASLGEKAQETARTYDWQNVTRILLEYCRSAIP